MVENQALYVKLPFLNSLFHLGGKLEMILPKNFSIIWKSPKLVILEQFIQTMFIVKRLFHSQIHKDTLSMILITSHITFLKPKIMLFFTFPSIWNNNNKKNTLESETSL